MQKVFTVYKIVNSVNNNVYIGMTSQKPSNRFQQHIFKAGAGRRGSLYDAIRTIGADNFSIETLFFSTSASVSYEIEQAHIAANRGFCYNVRFDSAMPDFEKLSKSLIAATMGKPKPDAHKANIRKAHLRFHEKATELTVVKSEN